MPRRVPLTELPGELDAVIDAAERGEATLVTRRGRLVAVIGPVSGAANPTESRRKGLRTVAGALSAWDTMDSDMAEIVAERQSVVDRAPPEFEAPA